MNLTKYEFYEWDEIAELFGFDDLEEVFEFEYDYEGNGFLIRLSHPPDVYDTKKRGNQLKNQKFLYDKLGVCWIHVWW